MDTPRKISAGRGSSRLVSSLSAPLVAPTEPAVGCGQILADGAHEPVINAVAVKLPELWTNRVRGWFACPSPNFFYVLQALSQRNIDRILDLLTTPAGSRWWTGLHVGRLLSLSEKPLPKPASLPSPRGSQVSGSLPG